MFSGGDAAKPLKVTLSASAAAQSRGWEAGLLGMRKGGVRYVAVSAAAVATEIQGRGEAGPGGFGPGAEGGGGEEDPDGSSQADSPSRVRSR